MTDLEALRRAVLADLGDDALRMVYADALLEAGDPRGELIAIETRLGHEAEPEQIHRRRELRSTYGPTWWPELRPRFVRSTRGFAEAIAVTPDELATIAPLVAREPVHTIEVYGAPFEAAHVAALPAVRHLRAQTLTTEAAARLLASPQAEQLASLDLSDSSAELVFGERLSRCRRVVLARYTGWMFPLMGWSHLGALEELDISGGFLEDYEVDELHALFVRTPALRTLRLSGNPIGDAGAAVVLRDLSALPRLAWLDAVDCGFSDAAIAQLRAARPSLVVTTEVGTSQRVELAGVELEVRYDATGWHLRLDGERWPFTLSYGRSSPIGGSYPRLVDPYEHDRLALFAKAIATGWPRELTAEGMVLSAGMMPIGDNEVDLELELDVDRLHDVRIKMLHLARPSRR